MVLFWNLDLKVQGKDQKVAIEWEDSSQTCLGRTTICMRGQYSTLMVLLPRPASYIGKRSLEPSLRGSYWIGEGKINFIYHFVQMRLNLQYSEIYIFILQLFLLLNCELAIELKKYVYTHPELPFLWIQSRKVYASLHLYICFPVYVHLVIWPPVPPTTVVYISVYR